MLLLQSWHSPLYDLRGWGESVKFSSKSADLNVLMSIHDSSQVDFAIVYFLL